MGITAFSGPNLTFGLTRSASGGIQEYNEQRGPDVSDAGYALYDPRPAYNYMPGGPVAAKTWGWWGSVGRVDAKPGTFTPVTIASCQQPVSGTALTLATGSSGCVTTGVTLVPASNPNTTVTVLAMDSTYATVPVGLSWGQAGTINSWDPQLAVSRCITILKATTSAGDDAGTYTIQGFDIYGYAMTETITGTSSTGSSVYNGVKAFKYIRSITPGGTIGSTTISVYPSNTYGFPLPVRSGWQAEMWLGLSSNMVQATAQTTLITFAATLTPTATGPDVRGTWASTNLSSNSSNFMFIQVRPRAQDVNNMTTTYAATASWPWLGIDQYSS